MTPAKLKKKRPTKVQVEALKILTGPSGPYDIFAEGVKKPEMMLQIVRENLDFFVSQNPQPPTQSPEELADALLHHLNAWKRATS